MDWTGAAFYTDLVEAYPKAIVLLSVRDADDWWRSVRRHHVRNAAIRRRSRRPWERALAPTKELTIRLLNSRFTPDWADEDAAKAAFERHNAAVRAAIPADRLVEWRPGDGWKPICDALGRPVPPDPFPHVNRTADFRAGRFEVDRDCAPRARERIRTGGVVGAITLVGAALRLVILQDSLFGDELSTYWIVSERSLGEVISTVHTDAEITPPLYFVLAWLTTRLDLTAEMLRAPSFLAGVAAIPLTYLLGLRTVGRAAALVASAITALSPFMIFYSTEARGYELMIVLVMLSTLALLAGVDDGRARWWVAYAAASCAAVYTHYTAVFVLAAQFLWVLWAHPEARRAALLANLGATAGFLPWISGLIADLNSPTTKILGSFQPLTLHNVRISLEHWSVGYPFKEVSLRSIPGEIGVVLIALGVATAIAGVLLNRGGLLAKRPPQAPGGRASAMVPCRGRSPPRVDRCPGPRVAGRGGARQRRRHRHVRDAKSGGFVAGPRDRGGEPARFRPAAASLRIGGAGGGRAWHRSGEDARIGAPACPLRSRRRVHRSQRGGEGRRHRRRRPEPGAADRSRRRPR